jgi:hypothetical protein
MLKYCQFIRRRASASNLEFRAAFDQYLALVQPVADGIGATAVRVSLGLDVDENESIMSMRGSDQPFDAMVEIYAPNLAAAMAKPRSERFFAMVEFQKEWFELERCVFFVAEEL